MTAGAAGWGETAAASAATPLRSVRGRDARFIRVGQRRLAAALFAAGSASTRGVTLAAECIAVAWSSFPDVRRATVGMTSSRCGISHVHNQECYSVVISFIHTNSTQKSSSPTCHHVCVHLAKRVGTPCGQVERARRSLAARSPRSGGIFACAHNSHLTN